jgi:hypothetical protein|uniref:MYM-type domain-containing protein n=1 Tax=viral metagenome TaxID=1070528 RepID=A0A6C0IRM4_9ZZZZ
MENTEIVKKKRGRKKKSEIQQPPENEMVETIVEQPAAPKKRGRKPKGGKLIAKNEEATDEAPTEPNVILHLKCSLKDVNVQTLDNTRLNDPMLYNPEIPPSIETYTEDKNNYYNLTKTEEPNNLAYIHKEGAGCDKCMQCKAPGDTSDISMKDINQKLKKLKIQYYKNLDSQYKPACFWCTYEYDNPACYIPKYEIEEEMFGYGSFCRPECASAFLMKENIDDSTKFERYHLLNKMYSKVYNYDKNIRPAPDPHYLLDKFYGNLSIQEYRKMLGTEHMLMIIEKPMTRILPELHEDNDGLTNVNSSGVSSGKTGMYRVKRQSEKQKGPTNNEIMKEKFGFS